MKRVAADGWDFIWRVFGYRVVKECQPRGYGYQGVITGAQPPLMANKTTIEHTAHYYLPYKRNLTLKISSLYIHDPSLPSF